MLDEDSRPIELGRGVMGVTYKAFDVDLLCPVTLKVIGERYLDIQMLPRSSSSPQTQTVAGARLRSTCGTSRHRNHERKSRSNNPTQIRDQPGSPLVLDSDKRRKY